MPEIVICKQGGSFHYVRIESDYSSLLCVANESSVRKDNLRPLLYQNKSRTR